MFDDLSEIKHSLRLRVRCILYRRYFKENSCIAASVTFIYKNKKIILPAIQHIRRVIREIQCRAKNTRQGDSSFDLEGLKELKRDASRVIAEKNEYAKIRAARYLIIARRLVPRKTAPTRSGSLKAASDPNHSRARFHPSLDA